MLYKNVPRKNYYKKVVPKKMAEKRALLMKLLNLWKIYPNLTFGQFIYQFQVETGNDLFKTENEKFESIIEILRIKWSITLKEAINKPE